MSGTHGTPRPRRHLHRGTVQAVAFWFDPALLGEGEARRRVLAGWTPGAAVLAVAEGYLLRLPRPRTVASDAAPGLPLTLEDGVLSSAPLSPRERQQLAPREGSAVLVRAGIAQAYPLAGAPAVDMAAWLDVSTWVTLPVKGLGAPPPPVPTLEPVEAPTRATFGLAVPTLAPEAQVMLARMQGRPPPPGLDAARPGLWARLRAALFGGKSATGAAAGVEATARRVGLLARLRAALSGTGTQDSARAVEAAGAAGAAGPGPLAWLRAALRFLAAPRAGASGGGALPGGAQGAGHSAQAGMSSWGRPGLLSWLSRWLAGNGEPRALPEGAGASGRPSWLSRMLAALFAPSGDGAEGGASAAGAREGTAPQAPQPKPSGPGMLSRMSEWMLRHTPLGPLLGQRKAEYVRRLFDMFEEGNLDEALRYAIPLGTGLDENARVALGLPGPREQLTIRTSKAGGGAAVFAGGEELYLALRERYRAAFRRLEREGRIDEAAFVLAELLGAHEEAVSFLERHERFRLAAELAEGRNLPPGLVVRQWFLAKDVARAVAIARRSGAFADAVVRLQNTHMNEARALRLLWAETLAESGDWPRAVQAVWPLEDARGLARTWVERGVECGGPAGARLLALWVSAFPGGLEAARGHVRALLEEDTPERASERFAFALTLAGESHSPGRTSLIQPTVRALLRDLAASRNRVATDFVTRLLRDAPDGALRTDLPALTDRPHRPWRDDPSLPTVHASTRVSDAGAFPLHDAAALPDGRLLLALGEAGARLLGSDGRLLAHFDVPAFALVPSVHGDRALALAPRGEVQRLSRLDLVRRRATPWCDARLDVWAPTYDGSVWFAASQGTVMMVDALAQDVRALWRVADVPGVLALAADAGRLSLLTQDLERWTYDLAQGPTLRSRSGLPGVEASRILAVRSTSLTPDGEVAVRVLFPPSRSVEPLDPSTHERTFWLKPHGPRPAAPVEATRYASEALVLGEVGRAEVLRLEGYWQVRLYGVPDTGRAALTFEGDMPVRVRLTPGALLAFDGWGRLLWLDLEEGTVRSVAVP